MTTEPKRKPSRTARPASPHETKNDTNGQDAAPGRLSRRRLLTTAGTAGAVGLAAGAPAGALAHSAATGDDGPALTALGSTAVPFHGTHQPGITTPAQAHAHLAAFDLAPGAGRREAAALLRRWSGLAAELMAGGTPEADTGVARDAGPASLSVTIGLGHGFFDATGLTGARPAALDPLPAFSADVLDEGRSNGHLWLQIGADDALVAFHALRALHRAAGETATLRWQMTGFNRTPGATARPMTTRNLMGQVDGTNNPAPGDEDFERHVFVPEGGDPAWMAGGSYVVFRRIRMLLDAWEARPLAEQERVMGRRKSDGAPLTGERETDPVDLAAVGPDGRGVIAANAHVRVTAPETNGGATMLRRSFSYHDGFRDDGAPDAGLLFLCWQADPLRAFVPVQRKLDRGDALSEFVRHEASGLFAVPGGAREGEYVGQALVEGY
ncbi:iron uptake transporter deferrochelatase/peroxidase subunit [Streptomyces marincola]|uniref:Deferrochelatase n=1 Tax=Streptomyces marincola TaxID=2878388 RepID=A0A1W7CY02_9ACTN|nr:iron uptake transporter deferrochelatase/peroxidase subunit [Streptomyces marincola]ARQ69688.1 deferrochelatase/peroxidase EfeB [Streptomyces marincola]